LTNKNSIIPHSKPTIGQEEIEATKRVLLSGNLIQGTEIESFEKEFCDFLNIPRGNAVAVSSGTSALLISLQVLKNDSKKVNFPGYVCSSLHEAVTMCRYTEVLHDVSSNSPNIEMTSLNASSLSLSIIPHMFGIPVDLSNVDKSKIIEDCCQALGAKVCGKMVGTQGIVGVFSFNATKLMTSGGQGGMIVSDDKEVINQIRQFLDYDVMRDENSRFNYQMTEIQAAIGREQLKKLPLFLKRRQEIFDMYKSAGFEFLDVGAKEKNIEPVRYRALLKTTKPQLLKMNLEKLGVKTVIPMEGWIEEKFFPNAYQLTKNLLSIPIYPLLKDEEVQFIIEKIKSITIS